MTKEEEARMYSLLGSYVGTAPELLYLLSQQDSNYVEELRSEAYEVYEENDWQDFINEVREEIFYCCALMELFAKKNTKIELAAKIIQQIDSIGEKKDGK
jgi:hypothetical protein